MDKSEYYGASVSFSEELSVSGLCTFLVLDHDGTRTGDYSIFFNKTGKFYESPIIVTEVIIISTVVAGTSLIALIVGTGWGKYKFLSFLSLLGPLYLKTVREDIFNNEKRLSMYNYIAENQPAVYTDIKKSLNLSHGEIN